MNQSLRTALERLHAGRPTSPSRRYRAIWTDGRALWTHTWVLAVPLQDGAWIVNMTPLADAGYEYREDLLRELRARSVQILMSSVPACGTIEQLLVAVGHSERVQARALPTPPLRVPKLGFELEVEFSRSRGSSTDFPDVLAALSNGVVTADGSLHNGWEFKSGRPLTLAEWRTQPLVTACKSLVRAGAVESHERAGLHVHVDRASFSADGLARLFTVVNHADEAVKALSRRGSTTNYCRFTPRSLSAWQQEYTRVGKYSAAFLHDEYPTVELRLFRSTVAPHRLLASLEAAESLWRFAMCSDLPPTGADWAYWVDEQPEYQLLACELRAQGVLPAFPAVHGAVLPLSKPIPAPPPPIVVAPAPAPATAPAPSRISLGLVSPPNGVGSTQYYWNPQAEEVEFRTGGVFFPTRRAWRDVTDTHWCSVWIRAQLTTRGLWAPPAATPPATPPAAPEPEFVDLGEYPPGGLRYRYNTSTRLVERPAGSGWAVSDYHRRDAGTPMGERHQWIHDALAHRGLYDAVMAQGATPAAPAVADMVDLGRDPVTGALYRFNRPAGAVEVLIGSTTWTRSDFHSQWHFSGADSLSAQSRRWAWIREQLEQHGVVTMQFAMATPNTDEVVAVAL